MSRGNVLLEAESFEAVDETEVTKETKEKSRTENGVYVKGMALPFGKTSRNGVQYEKESVERNHEDLQGRTMLFNHKQDWVTGHILNTEITEDGMFFEGDINPNAEMPNGVPVAEAIERGDINSVSIQAFIEQLGEEADEDAVINQMETEKVAVQDFLEISAVSIPGFPQAEALPEHLQNQGVQPVTEIVGGNEQSNQEETQEKKDNDEPSQEAPEFSDMGECISFHMDEKDMEQDQAVAVCMDKMSEEDLPEELRENISKEQFEFAPVPTHVLYDTEEKAKRRAENLGLEGIHEHQMGDQIFYMAGESHDAWLNAIERENPLDRGENTNTEQTFDDYPEAAQENARTALEAKEETGDPNNCGTQVGWERANQLDNGESLSEDTIGRMAAFERHEDNKDQGEEGRADCGWMMWNAWGGDEGIAWAQEKLDEIEEENLSDETKELLEEHDIMTDDESQSEDQAEQAEEQVSEQNFEEFVASHMEGADVADITEALSEYNFTGIDQGEVAALLAQEFDLDTGTVMDVIGDLEDMERQDEEEEVMDDKDDEDDDEEDDGEEENVEEENKDKDENQESLEETIEQQTEKINKLEERLENLLENDEGSSQQQTPSAEKGSETEPSFGDVL